MTSSPGYVTWTPSTQRSPDTGYGDSALLHDVTSGRDVTLNLVVSMATDDAITTPAKMAADFRLTALELAATSASVLRHQSSISVSGMGSLASKTAVYEKMHPVGEMSELLSVAVTTASSSPGQQQQLADNLQQKHSQSGIRNPRIIAENNPQLTELENGDKVELIHGGFGLKNPVLTRNAADPHNSTPLSSQLNNNQHFGQSYLDCRI